MIKKHPILFLFSIIFCICLVLSVFIIKDILHLVNYVNETNRKSYKVIGLNGLCKAKNIPYDQNMVNVSVALKQLDQYKNKFYVPELGKTKGRLSSEIDEINIRQIINLLRNFDENLKWSKIKELDWNNLKNANNAYTIEYVLDFGSLSNLCFFVCLLSKAYSDICFGDDAAFIYSAFLKLELLNSYTSKGFYSFYSQNQSYKYINLLFDMLKDKKCSKETIEFVLDSTIVFQKLLPDARENIKYEYEFNKNMIDRIYNNIPVIARIVDFVFGNSYESLNDINNKFMENYDKADFENASIYAKERHSFFIEPAYENFASYYNEHLTIKAKYAVFQAETESRLDKEITAIDPFDGKKIKGFKTAENKTAFYSIGLNKKDEKGKGDDIKAIID